MSLTFEALRAANVRRCEESFHALNRWGPMQWGCATAGEAGELCNLLKKHERDGNVPVDAVGDEAADVVCYLDLTCARMGIDLGAAVVRKFDVVSARKGSPVRLGPPAPVLTDDEIQAQGSREDQARFEGFRAKVMALDALELALPEDADLLHEDGPRLAVIYEIHADIASRHPLGIAVQLAAVINALACAGTCEDQEAIDLLDDLIDTEKRSREINGRSP